MKKETKDFLLRDGLYIAALVVAFIALWMTAGDDLEIQQRANQACIEYVMDYCPGFQIEEDLLLLFNYTPPVVVP